MLIRDLRTALVTVLAAAIVKTLVIHERVMFAPILEYAYFVSIGPRAECDAVNAIPANPYTAPCEDLRLAKR